MKDIDKIHDKFFKKTFSNPENARAFLEMSLPEPVRKVIDFSKLNIDPTNYVSGKFKELFSDIVVKTSMKGKEGEIDTDIYIILEHKCYRDAAIFIQLLQYMCMMWQMDLDNGKPPRIIIPLVFYHGKEIWTVPPAFSDQFNVPDEVKSFLLDYRYVLFDTRDWNFKDESNKTLKDNVFLLTALAMMKSAYKRDFDSIYEIFRFWYEKGFTGDRENVLFFLAYLCETKDMSLDLLGKILEESKIEGGDIMPTLAQRLRQEGKQEGEKEAKRETAKTLIKRGVDINIIAEATGLTPEELEQLADTVH
jgi:predicted transposase/invertase (TIGR01784 family)